MCLLDRIIKRKKVKSRLGYKTAPLMGDIEDFKNWKSKVEEGTCTGMFIVVPKTLNEEIEIYHSQLTNNGMEVVKGEPNQE